MRKTLTIITTALVTAGCSTNPLDRPVLDPIEKIVVPLYLTNTDNYVLDDLTIEGLVYDDLKEQLEPVRKQIIQETNRTQDINYFIYKEAKLLDKNNDSFVSFEEFKHR